MRRYLHHILLTVSLSAVALSVRAQENTTPRQVYAQAESDYQIGRLNQARDLLKDNLHVFQGNLRQNAIRLLSLCYMAQDSIMQSETYAVLLLKENPYYTSVQDPIRFEEMVNRLKTGRTATLTTASSQAESIEEVPVPVTLITEQMIKDCGADNLRDVLATYVPGMNSFEGNSEMNISMHGIYSSRQEKMLIMINGHRLNGRSSNAQAPDYGISLEKIKQIEVLRGPASSLYGNVALSAVVNIIIKEGRDIDGSELVAGIGSFSTYKAGGIIGFNRLGMDFTAWASVYNSNGERYNYSPSSTDVWRLYPLDGYATVNGFNHHPSYDVGTIFKWNNHWSLFSNLKYSKMQPSYTFTIAGLSAPSSYDKYRRIDGQKPGHGRTTWHNELSYQHGWNNWQIESSVYLDIDEYKDYVIVGDSLPGITVPLPSSEYLDKITLTNGSFQRSKWNDYTYGLTIKSNYKYRINKIGTGNLLFGLQWEKYKLYSSDLIIGDHYDRVLVNQAERTTQITFGDETLLSGFAQLKHCFSSIWILNAGLRTDFKSRFNNSSQSAFSPRIAIIYSPSHWSFKLSYARSFVDAPYLYRASNIASYRGGIDLKPEIMDAIQFSGIYSNSKSHLSYDWNIFYNSLTDLIYYDKTSASDQPAYQNAGRLKLIGVENMVTYQNKKLRVSLNATYMQVMEALNYSTIGKRINSIPAFTANLVLAKSLWIKDKHSVWTTLKMNYESKQVMSANSFRDGKTFKDEAYELNARLIPDFSLSYQYSNLCVIFQCKNFIDKKYTRGTLYNIDVPQLGRQWLISTKFKL